MVDAVELRAEAVVLTTGTFMRAAMHVGESRTEGGRIGEGSAVGIAGMLRDLGFGRAQDRGLRRVCPGRVSTGTRLPVRGDERPTPFSDLTDPSTFPRLTQVSVG